MAGAANGFCSSTAMAAASSPNGPTCSAGSSFATSSPEPGIASACPGAGAPSRLRSRSCRCEPLPPSTNIYDQAIPTSGYGYLTTRDGTKLAIDVRLPGGRRAVSDPDRVLRLWLRRPAGAQSGIAQIATLLGFAVVDVNMRGTGCSGGAFDYFEPLQTLDGYDVIETVAHQPWVLHHKVGMIGISYGGISQLFVAATDPPDLAAIAPLSVIDNTATTLYPGGILNTGFALPWAEDRVHDAGRLADAAASRGRYKRIQAGRPDVQGQPGAPRRGGQPDRQGPRQPPLRAVGGRPARSRSRS